MHITERFGVLSDSLKRLKLRSRAIESGQVGREITGEKAVATREGDDDTDDEKREVSEREEVRSELRTLLTRKSTMINETIINAAYFPLTLHWSVPFASRRTTTLRYVLQVIRIGTLQK